MGNKISSQNATPDSNDQMPIHSLIPSRAPSQKPISRAPQSKPPGIKGAEAEAKGAGAEAKGTGAETKGTGAEAKGAGAETKGAEAEAKGAEAEAKGAGAEEGGAGQIKDYAAFLRRQTVQKYIKKGKPHYKDGLLVAAGSPAVSYLPPNNCLFDITKVKQLSKETKPVAKGKGGKQIFARAAAKGSGEGVPKKFDWRKESKNITPALNQYLCGCCWAVSIATCIADKFVAYNLIDFHPKVSWTYLISCFVDELNHQCEGSNPNLALEWVVVNGVGTEAIEGDNYDWCTDSNLCNPEKSKVNTPKSDNAAQLQKLVPKCTFAKTKAIRFFIKNIRAITLTEQDAQDLKKVKDSIMFVRKHIMDYGPVVGGFSVFGNFKTGDYTCNGKNPSNIYLENVNYDTAKYQLLNTQTIGTHAVVLIGWGVGMVEESLLVANSTSTKKKPVDYWIVRNSWGTEWGIDGYFHIAHYPVNKKSQFDVSVVFTTSVKNPATGKYNYQKIVASGIITFQPSYFGYDKPNKTMIKEKYEPPLPIETFNQNNTNAYFFIAFLIIMTMIVFILILMSSSTSNKIVAKL